MTWGSHCPVCGGEDCRWSVGTDCDGMHRQVLQFGVRIDNVKTWKRRIALAIIWSLILALAWWTK